MSAQKFFRVPFAATGDVAVIPDAAQPSGALSYAEGFGFDYERNPTNDPAAKRIPRDQTNQLYRDITENVRQYQLAGFPEWVAAAQNGAVAVSYAINSYVRHNGGAGTAWVVYCAKVNDAVKEPGVAAGWETEWAVSAPVDPANLKGTLQQTEEGTGTGLAGTVELVRAARQGKWTYAGAGAWNGVTAGQLDLTYAGAAAWTQGAGAVIAFSVPTANTVAAVTLKAGANAALPLQNFDGSALVIGDLQPGGIYDAKVNPAGTAYRLTSPTASALAKFAQAGDGAIFGYIATNTPGQTNTQITMGFGNCRDSTNQRSIARVAPMTKRLDQPWAVGSGNGGRTSGTVVAANQTWHVHAILNDVTGATDIIFDPSPTAPTLPGGFTFFRRVFSFILDASGNIRQFLHLGDETVLKTRGQEWSATANGVAAGTLRSIGVPIGLKLKVQFYYTSTGVGGNQANPAFSGLYDPDVGVPTFGQPTQWAQIRILWTDANDRYVSYVTEQWCNTNAQIYTASNDTGDTIAGGVLGWADYRGRFV